MAERKLETLAVHAGGEADPATGAVTPPIHLSTTFERDADGSYPRGYVYTRTDNPNRSALETCLAALEGGEAAAAFASGSAAAAAVFRALLPGDHVVAPLDMYHGIRKLLREVLAPWGLGVSFVDSGDLGAVGAALTPRTRLIWLETPSNPLLQLTDIAAVAGLARDHGLLLACDNTWATPMGQRPLELGADLVVHATTKYLSGHSDVLGGAVVAGRKDGVFERVRLLQGSEGAVPSPFDCWLTLRGVRTLPYRMRGHSDNALRVAEFLERHEGVEAVHYPGLASHPQFALAERQMALSGGMLSVQLRGGAEAAMRVVARVTLFTRATSLGGVESLIEHRASVEGPDSQTPPNLLRLSVGLEHADDLIADLDGALG
ncbi:MAG: PLP-dependent transferase [Deinococcota bacterium]|jgi:cystathionine gamma-synthase|nr:PLP-dependent transferase [Deinococcota bacterium]